jgi:ornithine carbamoyltransferase
LDFTPGEIRYLLDLAHDLKAKKRAGIHTELLKGKNIVLLFEKTSHGRDAPLRSPVLMREAM